jgi:hypothetical protein
VRVRLGQPEAVLRVGRRGGEAALGPGRDGVHQARGASGEHQERAQSDRRQQSPAEQVSELSRRIHHPRPIKVFGVPRVSTPTLDLFICITEVPGVSYLET